MKNVLLEAAGGLVLAAAGLAGYALWSSGDRGVVDVPPSRVAVRVDHLTGELDVVAGPGYLFHLPFLQDVELFDRRPKTFRMEGEHAGSPERERFLTVRAEDGSTFWFESMEISYRLLPEAADRVLVDSGPGPAFRRWIGAYARAVLCDEYGRYVAQEVASRSGSKDAKEEARRRLNELLAPHGLEVVQIATPKPRFDREYEKAIHDRKVANQEVEKLAAQVDQLREERGQRLAKVEKEKKIELEELRGGLAEDRLEAEAQAIALRGEADAYATKRAIEAESREAELAARAETVRAKAERSAEGLAAMVEAVGAAGDAAVREAFVERLGGATFRLAPPPAPEGAVVRVVGGEEPR